MMKPLKEYIVQFAGLKIGEHCYEYEIDKKFFDVFEYEDFNDINAAVIVVLNKKTTLLEFNFKVTGTVNVHCDLTNEPYDECIENGFDLVVKFGDSFNDENEEIIIVPHGEHEINIAQYIYELIVLSLPSKRVHPGIKDGTLNSEMLDKLEELSPKGLNQNKDGSIDPRWNTLKKLLTDK
jgi:uncharacterized metal-binding protein YceD (DUF177 family)